MKYKNLQPPADDIRVLIKRMRVRTEIMKTDKPRARCARCHRQWMWGSPEYDGRLCSHTCADVPYARHMRALLYMNAPRCQCHSSKGVHKKIYYSLWDVCAGLVRTQSLSPDASFQAYRCDQGYWHVGSVPKG